MAVTYGFFNSVNGDRKYNAEQMSEYFRGIINEGVYQHLDGGLAVTAGTGLAVNVAAGRAIIQNRWIQNSAAMSLTIAAASETYGRKDAVVIRLNWSSRAISIAVKTGTPAASPVAPSMTRNSTTYEMALAYVNVAANATSVTVTDKRSDSTVCGWVTVAQSTSGEVDAQVNAMKTGFDGVSYESPAAEVQGSDAKIVAYMGAKDQSDEVISDMKYASGVSGSVDLSAFYTNVGKQINKNGSVSSNANGIVTSYIPVESGDQFEIMVVDDLTYCWSVAYYDINKQFISGINIPETSYTQTTDTFTVPSGVKYMRVQSLNQSYYGLFKVGSESVSITLNRLLEAIGDVTDGTKDLASDIIANGFRGKWLANNGATDGTESASSPYFCSDYIPVVEGEVYYYSLVQLYNNAIYALYSPQKKARIIQQGTSGETQTGSITIPQGIKYMKVCSMEFPTVFSFTKKFISPTIIEACKEIEGHVEKTPYDILDYYDEISTTWSNGYLNGNGTVDATNDYGTTDFISLDDYKQFNVFISYGWSAKGYALYNSAKGVLYTKGSSGGMEEKLVISTADILTDYPTAKYIRFTTPGNRKHAYGNRKCDNINAVANLILNTGNILYGKKIAFCGDSFTEANNLGSENYDNFYRCYKGFPYWIASRNNMNLYNDGKSGSTMHVVDPENPSTNRPFAYQRYQNVPTDCDYIILQFGLNESSIADNPATLGTKESTDTSTMWGSWNTVLHYLIENIPLAKIGVIMPDAWMTQSYYEALKEICEWWGIPLLDLGGDPNISLMNGGRRQGSGLVLNPVAAQIRNEAFYNDYSQGDAHPNLEGHKWRSTVIEHWIRGL